MNQIELLGQKLRELRENKKYSLRELAKKINIPYQTLSKYENGNSVPPSDVLALFATFYDVSTDYLLGITTHKTADPKIREVAEYLGLEDSTVELLLAYRELYDEISISKTSVLEIMLKDHDFLIVIDRCCAAINHKKANFQLGTGELDDCYKDAVFHFYKVIQENFFNIDSSSKFQNPSDDGMLIYKKSKKLLQDKK